MHRACFLVVTALVEALAGLGLLLLPSLCFMLLLGVSSAAPEAIFIGRLTGTALLAIGVTCWAARRSEPNPAQLGLLIGVLIYDVGAAVLLAYAGLLLSLVGDLLWPAVVLHTALASWCVVCLRSRAGQ